MDCGLLDTVLNGDCPTPFQGFKSVGYVYNWDDFDHQLTTKANGVVSLSIKVGKSPQMIYDHSQKPFKGVKVTGKQLEYSPAQDVEVILPFYAFGQVNTQNANALSGSRRKVLILEQYGVDDADRFVCIGLTKGLMTTVMSEPEANKMGYLATMSAMDCVDAQLIVDTTDAENLIMLGLNQDYELITGLSIAGSAPIGWAYDTWDGVDADYTVGQVIRNGASDDNLYICIQDITADIGNEAPQTDTANWRKFGKISIQVDFDKTAYCKLPNGTILTSTGGAIDSAWTGVEGSVVIAVPKDNAALFMGVDLGTPSDFIGTLQTNLSGVVNIAGCQTISSLIADSSTDLGMSGCTSLIILSAEISPSIYALSCPNLSAQSIYNALDNAYTLALDVVTGGTLDFGGTTTAIDLSNTSSIHSLTYDSISQNLSDIGWTVNVIPLN